MSVEIDQTILQAALEGFESQLAKLETRLAYVRSQVRGANNGSSSPKAAVAPAARSRKKGRTVSEEGRQRMADAQKRRWAKVHAAKGKK